MKEDLYRIIENIENSGSIRNEEQEKTVIAEQIQS